MDPVREQTGTHEPLGALWIGLTLAPAAWFLQLAVGYSLVPMACEHGAVWMLHLTSALALGLALGGLWTAWRTLQAAPASEPGGAKGASARRVRFMATAGILLSAFFALTVALAWMPAFIVESCPSL